MILLDWIFVALIIGLTILFFGAMPTIIRDAFFNIEPTPSYRGWAPKPSRRWTGRRSLVTFF